MKNRIKILLGAVIGSSLLLSSCNFLDVDNYFQATFKEDSIFHSMKNAEGYLWNTPTRFPDAGAIWGNSWNPGETASDEIAVRWQTNEFWGAQLRTLYARLCLLPFTDELRSVAHCRRRSTRYFRICGIL